MISIISVASSHREVGSYNKPTESDDGGRLCLIVTTLVVFNQTDAWPGPGHVLSGANGTDQPL